MTSTKPPETLLQFASRFRTEKQCTAYLYALRWPNGFVCPKCGTTKAGPLKAISGAMECENRHMTTVTAGTALHRSKIPLQTWFMGAWLVATLKPGISAVQFQRQLGLTRLETAWTMLHKLRSALVAPEQDKLNGECNNASHTEHWIEIDEVYVGGKESGKERSGRGAESKALVMVAVEVHGWPAGKGDPADDESGNEGGKKRRGGKTDNELELRTKAGRCRMRVVEDGKAATILPFILDNVERGSVIWTDDNPAYNAASRAGYHRMITVAKGDANPLPTLGRVTTNLKRWLIGTHKGAVQAQHLQAYLNEFTFRFNRRDYPWIAFNRVLSLAALGRPAVEYEGLYKHTWIHPNPTQGPMQAGFFHDE